MVSRQFRFITFCVSFLLMMAAFGTQAAPRYTVTALPAATNPTGINNAGQIVGDMFTPDGRQAFVWSAGSMSLLGTLGGSDSTATAINASGQVAGTWVTPAGELNAFLYSGGVMTGLNLFGGARGGATAINDAGQIAGQYYPASGGARGFLYTNGAAVDVGDLGGNFAYAAGINNAGQVVGSSALGDEPTSPTHAFLYAGGNMSSLGSLGGSRAEALDINNLRQVVGWGWVGGSEHAFFYHNGVMDDLGTLGGRRSYARSINESGIVVGEADLAGDEQRAAFIFMDGTMTDLNALVDSTEGWTLHSAVGINDAAQIAAYGCRGDECGAVLLNIASHVPEPGMPMLLLTGLAVLALGRQRSMSMCRIPSSSYGADTLTKPKLP